MKNNRNIKKGTEVSATLKAARKGSREAEIELYGKPLPKNKVHRSKRTYDRKKAKAGLKDLPLDYIVFFLLC